MSASSSELCKPEKSKSGCRSTQILTSIDPLVQRFGKYVAAKLK